jgi:hypothetical protein
MQDLLLQVQWGRNTSDHATLEPIVVNAFRTNWYRSLAVTASCLLALLVAPRALAQTDTALARQVYADINSRLGTMVRTKFMAQRPNIEYRSNVLAWNDTTGIRKLVVTDPDDDGDVVGEYFFDQGQLVFYFGTIKGYTEAGRQVARTEHRQYFREGRMFKWLAGLGSKSNSTPPTSTEFVEEAQNRLSAASFYLKTANESAAQQPKR